MVWYVWLGTGEYMECLIENSNTYIHGSKTFLQHIYNPLDFACT